MFVAVWPDTATCGRLARLELGPHSQLRPVAPAQWHVTLRFLGAVNDDRIPALRGALEEAASRCAGPVRCDAGPATAWFSGDRVLQLPVAGLDALADLVRDATAPIVPLPIDGAPPFVGHLTLGRARSGRIDPATRSVLEAIPFVARWTVDSIDLVASVPKAVGVHYATLARVALTRPTAAGRGPGPEPRPGPGPGRGPGPGPEPPN
jgi:2'-5' RNA ligase